GAPPLEVLAEAVNAATFSPHPPASAQAEAAVAAAVAHAAHVRGRSRRRVRAWWRWHPGPLWWAWRQRRATGRPSRPAWWRLAENVRRP
ncbi:MAG TPA: hypothetical protein VFY17_07320, partial [Pilimelia sp.]|nr:hypothetical protein [Pilimelia sp.]